MYRINGVSSIYSVHNVVYYSYFIDNVESIEDPSALVSSSDDKMLSETVLKSAMDIDVGAPSSARSQGMCMHGVLLNMPFTFPFLPLIPGFRLIPFDVISIYSA